MEASLPRRQQVTFNSSAQQSMRTVQHKNDRLIRSILTQFHTRIISRAAILCTEMEPFTSPRHLRKS